MTAAAAFICGVFAMSSRRVAPVTPAWGAHRAGGSGWLTEGELVEAVGLTVASADAPAVGAGDCVADDVAAGLGDGVGGRLPSGVSERSLNRSADGAAPDPSAAAMRLRAVVSMHAASTRRTS